MTCRRCSLLQAGHQSTKRRKTVLFVTLLLGTRCVSCYERGQTASQLVESDYMGTPAFMGLKVQLIRSDDEPAPVVV